jgi:hypothetical protein
MGYVRSTIQQVYHEETPEKLGGQGIDVYKPMPSSPLRTRFV